MQNTSAKNKDKQDLLSVFLVFLRLGLTSFGGPIAHLAYFRNEFVTHKKWLSEQSYADIVALCQFLPGPASSQVGMIVGMHRAGYMGMLAAWVGFTLPSAILLMAFSFSIYYYSDIMSKGVLDGLKIVTLVVVIQAIWSMAKSLCPDRFRLTIMVITTIIVLLMPSISTQIIVLLIAGCLGAVFLKSTTEVSATPISIPITLFISIFCLISFIVLLFVLPVFAQLFPNQLLELMDVFYRAGSLVFGGGHVVLPLLQSEVVSTEMLTNDIFLAGYGAAQAVPGPLFTVSAFLGVAMPAVSISHSILLGIGCLFFIFIPSFLLVIGVLPFWQAIQQNMLVRAGLLSINSAVVGILLAALFNPIWFSTIQKIEDVVFSLVIFSALFFWKLPVWLVVILSGVLGWGAAFIGFI